MAEKFTERAQSALNNALRAAAELGHTYIGTEHLLMGLIHEEACAAAKMLASRGVFPADMRSVIAEYSGSGIRSNPTPQDMTPRAKRIIESAYAAARQTPVGYIGTEHLLYAILEEKDCVATKMLTSLGVSIQELKSDILSFLGGGKRPEQKGKAQQSTEAKKSIPYGRNLTELAKEGKLDPIIGRDKEISRIVEILARRTKNNPCLLGDPGVGKTAIAEGLAIKLASCDLPEILQGKTLFSLDLSAMIAGAKYRGEFEERLKSVTETLLGNRNIILFIDELHTIVGAGAAEGAIDAANILKPLLARGEIQLIGATTIEEYRRYIEKDAALERRFQPVFIDEPSENDTLHILRGLKEKYETHHRIKITDDALKSAVLLSERYIADRHLPDKAIDLLDEAAARLRIRTSSLSPNEKQTEKEIELLEQKKENAIRAQDFELAAKLRDQCAEKRNLLLQQRTQNASAKGKQLILSPTHIAEVVTAWTGIPTEYLNKEDETHIAGLETALNAVVIGQSEAARALAEAIQRNRTGIRDPGRPIGSFMFVGPTGVGKTEMSKALARELYGKEESLIRLDMSEYKESFSVSKMIGSPPGYVGYEEGGKLTEQVRRHPYSVILFDEIEKAHESVFHLLLQILDDGVLTDSHGRQVSFKNTILILTSNLGANHLTDKPQIGFSNPSTNEKSKEVHARLQEELRNFFHPEFINRLDEIIIFQPLDETSRFKITKMLSDKITARLAALGVKLSIDDASITLLAKQGFDKLYGARPLRRIIIKKLETPLSEMLLKKAIKSGSKVQVTTQDNLLHFSVKAK